MSSFAAGLVIALTASTFSGINAKARDTERQTDIKAIHAQTEAYFAQKGYYPTLENMNDKTWRSINLKELNEEAFKDPEGSSYLLAKSPIHNAYSYEVKGSNDRDCNNTTVNCVDYTLSATQDNGTVFSRVDLN